MTLPTATATGGVAGCTRYHTVVAGDGCWAIANEYGISLNQFIEWNPAGKYSVSLACLF